jgi:hypothetical protein
MRMPRNRYDRRDRAGFGVTNQERGDAGNRGGTGRRGDEETATQTNSEPPTFATGDEG